MPAGPLRWGLLSTARINRALIPAIRGSRRNTLLAVASRSQTQAQQFARTWGIPRAVGEYQALLDDPDIDVVYNPLPNHLHAGWTVRALQAGKHVLCEKPLALSVAEVERMIQAAESSGRILAEAFMYRHHPQTEKARELVAGGALGELHNLRGCFTFRLTREGDIRREAAMGGGSLWDVGCYPANYIRFLAGAEPEKVLGWSEPGPGGVDEAFTGLLRFPGGVLAQFDCGFRSPFRTEVEVVGSRGRLLIPSPFKPGRRGTLILELEQRSRSLHVRGMNPYQAEVENLADAILLGKEPRVSLADSLGNTRTLLALLESARTGIARQP